MLSPMRNGKREISGAPLPVTLVYGTALTCGVLAAIAVQIQINRAGFDFIGLWQNLFSSQAMQLRSAGPWWAIAGMAFIVGGAVAAALSRVTLPWRRLRLLQWAVGTGLVFLLADIGHHAATLPPAEAAANTAATLAVLMVAGLMALCGAYFTVRR
jgi:hypothetical protein